MTTLVVLSPLVLAAIAALLLARHKKMPEAKASQGMQFTSRTVASIAVAALAVAGGVGFAKNLFENEPEDSYVRGAEVPLPLDSLEAPSSTASITVPATPTITSAPPGPTAPSPTAPSSSSRPTETPPPATPASPEGQPADVKADVSIFDWKIASSEVPVNATQLLIPIAESAIANGYRIRVVGYSDNSGSNEEASFELSRARANAIALRLARMGVASQDIHSIGAGPDRDAHADSAPEIGRRVDVYIIHS